MMALASLNTRNVSVSVAHSSNLLPAKESSSHQVKVFWSGLEKHPDTTCASENSPEAYRESIKLLLKRKETSCGHLKEFAMALVKARGEAKAQDVLALQRPRCSYVVTCFN